MKRLLLAALLGTATASAQRVITMETADELITTAALDSVFVDDVAVLDRATGVLRIGTWNGSSLAWTTTGAGLTGAEWLTAGNLHLPSGNPMTLLALSAAWQQAELYTPATEQRGVLSGIGILPSGIALLSSAGGPQADAMVASSGVFAEGPELSLFLTGSNPPALAGAALQSLPVLRRGSRVQSMLGEAGAFLTDSALQLWRPSGNLLVRDAELTGLTAESRYATGRFGITSIDSFVVWTPGAASFQHVAQLPGGGFGTPQTWNAGLPVGRMLAVISPEFTANDWLLAISQDGDAARLFNFTPGSAPVLRQSFTAPPGTTLSAAVPQAGGHFLLLNGTGGQTTGWQRAVFNGTSHAVTANAQLPAVRRSSASPTLFLFGSDPWLNPGIPLAGLLDFGDWTTSVGPGSVFLLTDGGLPSGLGMPASASLPSPFFAQPSQVRTDVSLASLGAARSVPRPEVVLSPPPGRYPPTAYVVKRGTPQEETVSAPLTVSLSVASSAAAAIRWRFAGGAWMAWDPENPPALTTDGLFEAYAAHGTGSPAGPVVSGLYSFGTLPALTTPPFADADGNGLSDLWEKTFAVHDPSGDKDGDGFTNLQEQQAGTDPCNVFSVPGLIDPGQPQLVIVSRTTTTATLRLTGKSGVIHRIESSVLMTPESAWQPFGAAFTMPAGGSHEFTIPLTGQGAKRFFRGVAGQ